MEQQLHNGDIVVITMNIVFVYRENIDDFDTQIQIPYYSLPDVVKQEVKKFFELGSFLKTGLQDLLFTDLGTDIRQIYIDEGNDYIITMICDLVDFEPSYVGRPNPKGRMNSVMDLYASQIIDSLVSLTSDGELLDDNNYIGDNKHYGLYTYDIDVKFYNFDAHPYPSKPEWHFVESMNGISLNQ